MAKVKTIKEEWLRFLDSDVWKEGMYLEFSEFMQNDTTIENDEELEDGLCYLIDGLVVHDSNEKEWSLVSLFNKWRKQQDIVSLNILVKKDDLVAVKAELKRLEVIVL